MKGAGNLPGSLFSWGSIVGATLLVAATVAPVFASQNDWTLVSAPPPPGPYRAVNLDPRIPGADNVPTIREVPALSQPINISMPMPVITAPADGRQANHQVPRLPPQVPGSYQSMMPGPLSAPRYPMHMGRQNPGSMPFRGFYPPYPYPSEQVVPPPPVYDAMRRSPPAVNHSSTGR